MIDKEIVRIWKTYLDIDAVRLITVAPTVLKRTRMRAKYSALYGPDIFAEALIDAVKNIKSGMHTHPRYTHPCYTHPRYTHPRQLPYQSTI